MKDDHFTLPLKVRIHRDRVEADIVDVSSFVLTLHNLHAFVDSWTLNYKEGTGLGNIVLQDDNVQILEGVALGRAWFSKVSKTPAKFYGSVRYESGHECYSSDECNDNDAATDDLCSANGGNSGVCSNVVISDICGNR